METPYHRKCRIEVDFPTHSHNSLTQKRNISVEGREVISQVSKVSMCTTHTHTHPTLFFLFSSRGDVHKNDTRVLSDCLLNNVSVEWGGGVGYGEFSKGCNSPEGGGPLASRHCFALLCSLERGFFLNPTDYVENGGKRIMGEDGIVVQVHVDKYM